MPMKPILRRRPRRLVALLSAGVLLLGGCATLDQQQREWIFQPGTRSWWGGLAAAEGMQERWIEFRAQDGGEPVRLHALWAPAARADAPLLLYLHGARYDVRGSSQRMRRLQGLGFSVLGIDYRGFGRSTPALPSEQTDGEDALAAWDWLAAQHPDRPRFVFGHSLGGAIAVQLASQRDDVSGLIVEGGFTSIPELVRHFKWGWLPLGPLITQRFEAAEHIAQVRAPVLVVHGSEDQLIPSSLGRALYKRARSPKRFVLVDGGTHHSTNALGQVQYRQALAELFGLRGAE